MLKRISNKKLILVLGGLVALYFVIDYTGGKNRSKSFRSTLVDIDTAKVSALEIEKQGNFLRITRTGSSNWELELKNGKKVTAKASNVKSALLNLIGIKPSRLASKDPSKWKDYQVDSAGEPGSKCFMLMIKPWTSFSDDLVLKISALTTHL